MTQKHRPVPGGEPGNGAGKSRGPELTQHRPELLAADQRILARLRQTRDMFVLPSRSSKRNNRGYVVFDDLASACRADGGRIYRLGRPTLVLPSLEDVELANVGVIFIHLGDPVHAVAVVDGDLTSGVALQTAWCEFLDFGWVGRLPGAWVHPQLRGHAAECWVSADAMAAAVAKNSARGRL